MTSGKSQKELDVEFLIGAYRHGFFPMADAKDGSISWYSPDPRAIIPLGAFIVSRSLKQVLQKNLFEIRVNTSFEEVVRRCAERAETWISGKIIEVYTELHHKGFAHSVESWHQGSLVGGLYGVALGGAFFGESMFSRMPNASKVALVHLVGHLNRRGFTLLDTQFMNEHVRQFGAIEIPRSVYLERLAEALARSATFEEKPEAGLASDE